MLDDLRCSHHAADWTADQGHLKVARSVVRRCVVILLALSASVYKWTKCPFPSEGLLFCSVRTRSRAIRRESEDHAKHGPQPYSSFVEGDCPFSICGSEGHGEHGGSLGVLDMLLDVYTLDNLPPTCLSGC